MAFELAATIPAPPDRVFAVLSDLDHAREWMPAIRTIEPLGSGPLGLGAAWRETRAAGKRTMESTIRVTAFEPNAKLGLEVEAKGVTGAVEFDLAPSGGGTQVRYRAQMKGHGLMALMTGTINRMMAKEDADLLERLRAQVAKPR